MLGNVYAAGITPLFSQIIAEFHISSDEASQLSTYTVLSLGVSVSPPSFPKLENSPVLTISKTI